MSWDRVRGHADVKQSFRGAFAAGRLGQSFLFVGPDGVGKQLFARELAKALLCERPPAPLTACDHCPGCAQVEAETHPDYHTLRTPAGKQELPVDEMRAFCARLARKPSRGNRTVGVVIDADDFNAESANSFLKTLEEPPPGAVLVLIATGLDRQLPTILSRCQVVRFQPLNAADVARVLEAEGVEDPARRERLARLAGGSVARAVALDDDAIWQVRETLIAGVASPRPNFAKLAEAWQKFVEDAGDDSAAKRTRASVVIGFLVDALRQALRLALGSEVGGLDPADEPRLRALAERHGPDRLLELIEKCVEADYRVERRVQLILVIESVLEQVTRVPK
ncbi:dna polymerase tau gamma subunit : DNA polymerase III, delta'' subunit OS=Singulisphaera acidiphila (strain ATCC BAA-1392 / DSM 18658 / VKM B-2454 / MOB10) GN=Sinac_4806 PE=4 SV=1: DNA_pol3_delta2 [Gemmataceae bacterium]|nr:dna polymerase tau gamma subunit : DNA polymerase III, delta'' subunit OS=Singulisphaera acidiphila (strain ATCC BAA-1392 / DSM 18658 / VKM B-2454 / MOB10) GN=Sinac_4806 PE=4 SV=1: DNA_pol3_delta2 [Gemmataceae bacterium]VTT96910.1 dna polymerase tau gamma subunit : DNA polymerase III, delta'' subunit OS=Singulisphaera acidiphila (strain ATCC BAA-1392 / DSM 18658 / VKM B-2454 / MOB10) GN=Sinac_4806 PE=4 SV=1: DNA_pol3_delta2 [Gemmataceae bacterium]